MGSQRPPSRRPDRGGAPHRGVALILVLTTIAILTAISVEFSYGARVDLRLAENLRDETRAHYLARSAINLSRLLLHFQKQLDAVSAQLGPALQGLQQTVAKVLQPKAGAQPPPAPLPGAQGQAAGGGGGLTIRLWEIIPVDSNMLGSVLAGSGPSADLFDDRPRAEGRQDERRDEKRDDRALREKASVEHSFGAFDGSYSAKVTDENTRINVVGLAGLSAQQLPAYLQMRALIQNPKFDFIFDEDDANHDRVRREDVIIALKDWIDEDEVGSALDPGNLRAPFTNGFSDENAAYDRYLPRYKAKNDRPDSLDELYMVRGVNDRFMAAFGDRLTVWLDKNARININSSDPLQSITNILAAANNPHPKMCKKTMNPNMPRTRDHSCGVRALRIVAYRERGSVMVFLSHLLANTLEKTRQCRNCLKIATSSRTSTTVSTDEQCGPPGSVDG